MVADATKRQPAWQPAFRSSAWYQKARHTFIDAMAQVRGRYADEADDM